MERADPAARAFAIPRWMDTLGASIERHPRIWKVLGDLESAALRERTEHLPIEAPIYICGLARSGSTILLECLARHPHVATHAYRDFPLIYTPCFWNRFIDRAQTGTPAAVERAHGDGIEVTPDSPEAMEEVMWMGFLPHLHRLGVSDVLGAVSEFPPFEAFYRDHIRKLLWLRQGRRYLSKGNYNTTRIAYLARLFPDARFVVPVRDPVAQVVSLLNQHRRFTAWHRRDPRARRYMRRLGHFEFGLDRRPVHTGDDKLAATIRSAWLHDRDVEGYALSWDAVYGHVARLLEPDSLVRSSILVVRHEDLREAPARTLQQVLEHCRLPFDPHLVRRLASGIRTPADAADVDADTRELIRRLTAATAQRFGYADDNPQSGLARRSA
ncbi:MAG: sulfotransferase [Sinimarinibacterium sp.]|jgi:hypothetical protein